MDDEPCGVFNEDPTTQRLIQRAQLLLRRGKRISPGGDLFEQAMLAGPSPHVVDDDRRVVRERLAELNLRWRGLDGRAPAENECARRRFPAWQRAGHDR